MFPLRELLQGDGAWDAGTVAVGELAEGGNEALGGGSAIGCPPPHEITPTVTKTPSFPTRSPYCGRRSSVKALGVEPRARVVAYGALLVDPKHDDVEPAKNFGHALHDAPVASQRVIGKSDPGAVTVLPHFECDKDRLGDVVSYLIRGEGLPMSPRSTL